MHENEELYSLVEGYKQSRAPINQWVGKSLEEIYLESGWTGMVIKGNPHLKYSPQFVRIVALRDNRELRGVSMALGGLPRTEAVRGIMRLRQETRDMVGMILPPVVDSLIARSLMNAGKQAAAALELSVDLDGKPVVQVLYPIRYRGVAQELFGMLGMQLGEDLLPTAAAALSIHLLKSDPTPESEPILLTPENLG